MNFKTKALKQKRDGKDGGEKSCTHCKKGDNTNCENCGKRKKGNLF